MTPFHVGNMQACRTRGVRCAFIFLLLLLLVQCGTMDQSVEDSEPLTTPKTPEEEQALEETDKEEVPDAERTPIPIINPRDIPATPREMRAVWVATVDNIDWPSQPGLPVAQQKAELRELLDQAAAMHFNAVLFQVRPAADALYPSDLEPWSEFLTGAQGRAPEPAYDPLQYAIEEAHRRGLELHAWFNPFRAWHFAATSAPSPFHISQLQPDWVVEYGRYKWLDPGWPAARRHSLNVILDVARRYDIDGVHLDDYFYPYPETGAGRRPIDFPDSRSYRAYRERHGSIDHDDWRRQNINRFVATLYAELEELDHVLRFGISPFGIWRPGNPAQITGFDAYAGLYADARKWLNEGWVDYMSPQLYWPIDQTNQSFPVLLNWWESQNTFNRYIWPGLYTSQVGRNWQAGEVVRQIEVTRSTPGVSGAVHFSMQALLNNSDGIAQRLTEGVYAKPAIPPVKQGASRIRLTQPAATLQTGGDLVTITLHRDQTPRWWVVKLRYGSQWTTYILPGCQPDLSIVPTTTDGSFTGAVISAVNADGIESTPQMLLAPAVLDEYRSR